jgi:hypothetical protein
MRIISFALASIAVLALASSCIPGYAFAFRI